MRFEAQIKALLEERARHEAFRVEHETKSRRHAEIARAAAQAVEDCDRKIQVFQNVADNLDSLKNARLVSEVAQ